MRLLNKYPLVYHTDCISMLSGCKLAVDGHNLMHYVYNAVENALFIRKHDQQSLPEQDDLSDCAVDQSHLVEVLANTIVSYLAPLLSQGISLVMVMDGMVPKEKLPLCTKRRKKQQARALCCLRQSTHLALI